MDRQSLRRADEQEVDAPAADEVPGTTNAHVPVHNPQDRIQNGRRAQALLEDPLLNAVFDSVAHAYRQSWENSTRGELEKQQIAHLSLAALKDVVAEIRRHLMSAKIFEADLENKRRYEEMRSGSESRRSL